MEREPTGAGAIDLIAAVRDHPPAKPVWARLTTDLAINLVTLAAGEQIAEHINAEVDVLFVGVDGAGAFQIDGESHALTAGTALVVPKGARRSIVAGAAPFSYLSCHRARKPLGPRVPAPRPDREQT